MLITETELKLLIQNYLLEDKAQEKSKLFTGEYYESKDKKLKGMTLLHKEYQFSYFLLQPGTKINGVQGFKKVSMPKKGSKSFNWSSELDEYKDYSQTKFFEHIKAGRIATGTSGNFQEQENYSQLADKADAVETFFYDFGYDTVASFAGALELVPIPGIQQAAMALSKGMSAASFVSACRKGEMVSALFATIGLIPVLGGAAGTALKQAEKARKAGVLPSQALKGLKEVFKKFMESEFKYTITSTIDKILHHADIDGTGASAGITSATIMPKMQSAAKSYIKKIEEELEKAKA